MEPKTELLVFNKKEIGAILVLLVLVALFSFTLGLRLGKALGVAKATQADHAPLGDHAADAQGAHENATAEEGHETHPAAEGHEAATHENSEHAAPSHSDEHGAATTEVPGEKKKAADNVNDLAQGAEDRADKELAREASKEKVAVTKPVPMSLPTEKKGVGKGEISYTLQVGSHRTVAEAAEQVTTLKRHDLEAFYLEAKVPGKGTWYRVGVGVFPTKDVAERTALKWKANKALPGYIVQKINE